MRCTHRNAYFTNQTCDADRRKLRTREPYALLGVTRAASARTCTFPIPDYTDAHDIYSQDAHCNVGSSNHRTLCVGMNPLTPDADQRSKNPVTQKKFHPMKIRPNVTSVQKPLRKIRIFQKRYESDHICSTFSRNFLAYMKRLICFIVIN